MRTGWTGRCTIKWPSATLALVLVIGGSGANAQQTVPPYPQSPPPTPSTPAYQQQNPPQSQPSLPANPAAPQLPTLPGYPATPFNPPTSVMSAPTSGIGSTLRGLFAMTLGAVLMSTGSGVAVVLEHAITGSILGWFSHKPQPAQSPGPAASGAATASLQNPIGAATTSPGGTAYPGVTSYAGSTTYPASTAYPGVGSSAGAATAPGVGYPGSAPAAGFSAVGGNPTSTLQSPTAPTAGAGGSGPNSVYAGLAYEVHLVSPDGSSTVVDPGSYLFHSGDNFLVYFRPSLPGQMQVDNVNASGKRTTIDTAQMAAGQLTTLGPYQFTGEVGDESLHFVLTACSTPQLLTRTRDIVNVAVETGSRPSLQLVPCGTATRGDLQTRAIQKVAAEGSTYFALDPVAAAEATSGQLAPREFTLVFHHR